MESKQVITVQASINAPIKTVWDKWTNPIDIMKWNSASEDWHTTKAENDVRAGGKFNIRMEAKDGSSGFDFAGVYNKVQPRELIEYTLEDGRKVNISFSYENGKTHVVESFEAENENSKELQQSGWQSILDNFKKHTEANSK